MAKGGSKVSTRSPAGVGAGASPFVELLTAAAGVAGGGDAFGRGVVDVVDWSESESSMPPVATGRVPAAGSTGPTGLGGAGGEGSTAASPHRAGVSIVVATR